jgi:hypothetical protein
MRICVENDSYRAATGELPQISALQTALTQIGEQTTLDPATRQAMEKLKAMGGPSSRPPCLPSRRERGHQIASACCAICSAPSNHRVRQDKVENQRRLPSHARHLAGPRLVVVRMRHAA